MNNTKCSLTQHAHSSLPCIAGLVIHFVQCYNLVFKQTILILRTEQQWLQLHILFLYLPLCCHKFLCFKSMGNHSLVTHHASNALLTQGGYAIFSPWFRISGDRQQQHFCFKYIGHQLLGRFDGIDCEYTICSPLLVDEHPEWFTFAVHLNVLQ